MIKSFVAAFAVALAAVAAAPSLAHDYTLGELLIVHPWAGASIGKAKAGAAYLTISNQGEAPDRLIAVETPAAKRAELHTHLIADGIMKMRRLKAVEVAPGEPTVFQPGGLHIMLLGLEAPLIEGDLFKLTLTFERAGKVEVDVIVQEPAAPQGHSGHGAGHGS